MARPAHFADQGAAGDLLLVGIKIGVAGVEREPPGQFGPACHFHPTAGAAAGGVGHAGDEGGAVEGADDFVGEIGIEQGDIETVATRRPADAGLDAAAAFGNQIGVALEGAGEEAELIEEGGIGDAGGKGGVQAEIADRGDRVEAHGGGIGKAVVLIVTRGGTGGQAVIAAQAIFADQAGLAATLALV